MLKHMFLNAMGLLTLTTLKTSILIITVDNSNTMTVHFFMTSTIFMDSKKSLSRRSQALFNFLSPKLVNLTSYVDIVHGLKNQMTCYQWLLILVVNSKAHSLSQYSEIVMDIRLDFVFQSIHLNSKQHRNFLM